jgi:hypothetical protein
MSEIKILLLESAWALALPFVYSLAEALLLRRFFPASHRELGGRIVHRNPHQDPRRAGLARAMALVAALAWPLSLGLALILIAVRSLIPRRGQRQR